MPHPRSTILASVLVGLLAIITLMLVPVRFEPAPFDFQFGPRSLMQEQQYQRNIAPRVSSAPFDAAEILFAGQALAPEDMAVSPDGERAFMGLEDGRLVLITTDAQRNVTLHEFARTGTRCGHDVDTLRCGRPLGLVFAPATAYANTLPNDAKLFDTTHVLLVADAYQGLLLFDAEGQSVALVQTVDDRRIEMLDALVVLPSGDIFMTQATQDFAMHEILPGCLQRKASGRLLRFNPRTGTTTVVATNLGFPNGIVSIEDGSALLVAMTFQHKIVRVDLTTTPPQIHDFAFLPGPPDNLWIGSVGTTTQRVLFVGLAGMPRGWRAMLSAPVTMRKFSLLFLPLERVATWMTGPDAFAMIDPATGDILRVFEARDSTLGVVSGVRRFHNDYYVLSWTRPSLVRFPLTAMG